MCLLFAQGCSRCLPVDMRVPRTAKVAKLLARSVSAGAWGCANQDWNNAGYGDAVKGRACDSAPPELLQLVSDPQILAAIKGPKGDVGVVSTDWRVGYAASADAGITWVWQMTDCLAGQRCFDEL